MNTILLKVKGMHCGGCKMAVETALKKVPTVLEVNANPDTGLCELTYSGDVTSSDGQVFRNQIAEALLGAGYSLESENAIKEKSASPLLIWIALVALFLAVIWFSPIALPAIGQIPATIGFGALFSLGLMTSIHCIGMCGGINLSVTLTTKTAAWKASAAYNLGRIVSYTLVGGILGAIGGTFNLSTTAKGGIAIAASLLMIVMALKQLGFMRSFKIPNWIQSSGIIKLQQRIKPGSMPFVVGILNALMPCGPLQAMQLYALSTGEWWLGAAGMFIFALGTVPLMFTFGLSAATIGKKFTKPLKIGSALLLIILAVISLQRGIVLAAPGMLSFTADELPSGVVAVMNGDVQEVFVQVSRSGYQNIVLAVNIPAKITFVATDSTLTGCNEAIMMPAFNIQTGLAPGETTVTFTPTEIGDFDYSCWMGMLFSTVHVVEALPNP